MTMFKKGDKVRCINAEGWRGITMGKEYEVVGMSSGVCVHLLKDDDGSTGSKPFAHRFELAGELTETHTPKSPEQEISTEFEIRWHRSKGDKVFAGAPMSGRVISRRPTQQLAEDFIEANAGNYSPGEFSITQVTVLKRVQQVRRVKRVTTTVHELVDA
ncbi:hypothetical protein [Burkholderia ubonensis]|uniref:hypothetical protein n=1 Tax=Burkholderia ubonensis TaxID=101571 RepID=UPI002AB168EE|nr:hypothetical protein [Burkholderia ubonensis]